MKTCTWMGDTDVEEHTEIISMIWFNVIVWVHCIAGMAYLWENNEHVNWNHSEGWNTCFCTLSFVICESVCTFCYDCFHFIFAYDIWDLIDFLLWEDQLRIEHCSLMFESAHNKLRFSCDVKDDVSTFSDVICS